MKIRTKIALVFTVMTGTILLMLSCYVYIVSRGHASEYFYTRLRVRASMAAESQFGDQPSNSASSPRLYGEVSRWSR